MVGLLLFPHEILHLPSIFCSSSAASKPSPRSRRRSSRRSAAQRRGSAARSAANFAAAKSAGSWALEAVALGGSSAQQMDQKDQKCRKIQGKIGEN